MAGRSTVTARGVLATASSREEIGIEAMASLQETIVVGITMTARGVVMVESGAKVMAELEQVVPNDKGIALRILNSCNINKGILEK